MKLLRWIILPPIALLVIALAVANRAAVTFSLDPFDTNNPAIAFDVPLSLLLLAATLIGILIGGMGAWLRNQQKQSARKPRPVSSETLPATLAHGGQDNAS